MTLVERTERRSINHETEIGIKWKILLTTAREDCRADRSTSGRSIELAVPDVTCAQLVSV